MSERRLVVFAKAPVIGGAKSRLAADIGAAGAWRVYRAMCARLFPRLRDPRWETVLAVTPDRAAARAFSDLWGRSEPRVGQGSGDLGDRLERVLNRQGPTIVIGADAPQVTAHDIWCGFKALRRADLVFGPAADGGFWLIGVSRPTPRGALSHIRWSSGDALADTQAAFGEAARVVHLRRLRDVDDGADWRAVRPTF